MTEHNIEIPCNTEVVIRVSCKEVAVDIVPVIELPSVIEPTPEPAINPLPILDPVVDAIPLIAPAPIPVEPEPISLPPVIIDSPIPDPVTVPLPPLEPIPLPPIETTSPVETVIPPEHCYCDLG
jgi:hypothetical protein